VRRCAGGAGPAALVATARANLAFVALAALSFVMLLGGSWFAYYIRQELSEVMHFAMIIVAIAGAILVNLPAA
jgi:hypothetical protein